MVRTGDFNHMLRFWKVTSQFLVYMYAKIEAERLTFISLNQNKLRYATIQMLSCRWTCTECGQQVLKMGGIDFDDSFLPKKGGRTKPLMIFRQYKANVHNILHFH
jgi:hypothetical protein